MDELDGPTQNYTFKMTPKEIQLAETAARLSQEHLKGTKLEEALKIGEGLLVGRFHAMKAAGTNSPKGKNYSVAFAEWKQKYGFIDDKATHGFYDDAIVCAENRKLARTIIDQLTSKTARRNGCGWLG
jgi:hypothetical protein